MLEPRDEFSGAKIIPLLKLWLADVGRGSTQGEGAPGLGDEEARCTAAQLRPLRAPRPPGLAPSLNSLESLSPPLTFGISLFLKILSFFKRKSAVVFFFMTIKILAKVSFGNFEQSKKI